jgi:hydrogenase small subunit
MPPEIGPLISPSEKTSMNRRGFLKFCGLMAATLALPSFYARRIASALSAAQRLPVVWLEFQDCTGDTESFLRASPFPNPLQGGNTMPGLVDILLDYISVEYHETIMAPAGFQSEQSLANVLDQYSGQFLCIVEGSIPTASNGAYCTIRGRTALSIAQQVIPQARAVIAAGSCAWDGGLAAAAPNPTGAVGVNQIVPGLSNLVNLPGCPSNVVNLVATIVYFLTYDQLPDHDSQNRPYFAYGEEIHDECERHDYYEADQFVLEWGDTGHQQGWCLFKMGCRGPRTDSNCPKVKWNESTSWPIGAGHGCIGCTSTHFWDANSPFYTPLEDD